jgi:peptidoglycan/xylan/chitin deacetylase (PgdA/CDA1 family)
MLIYQKIPIWLKWLFPNLIWEKSDKNSDKVVYLTFDDGPTPEITNWVLDELNKHMYKATFFCVGENAVKYPEIIDLIKLNQHSIGNHTMNHIKGWNYPTDKYIENIEECNKVIESKLFRPPYGRISKKQIKALSSNYNIIMWSLLSCDFIKNLNTKKALTGLIKNTKNGSIIVFHDSLKCNKNLRIILPEYLNYLSQNGYHCLAL